MLCVVAAVLVPAGVGGQDLNTARLFDKARWEIPPLARESAVDGAVPIEPAVVDRALDQERSAWTSPLVGALIGTGMAAAILAVNMRGNDDPFDPVSLVVFYVLPGTVAGAAAGWVFDRIVYD